MPDLTTTSRPMGWLKCVCAYLSVLFLTLGSQSCSIKESQPAEDPSKSDFLFQYSVLSALQAGVFDGNMTFGQLKTQGDFGVGTFNRVDGELVINEGKMYRIRSDGSVSTVADQDSSSLAFVKFFKADSSFTIQSSGMSMEALQQLISSRLSPNELYAIRIKGSFSKLTSRVPAAARKPYPTLADHLAKTQVIFYLANTSGVAVGYLVPSFMDKLNSPGFHFHYLPDDLKAGGHVYDFTATQVTVEIDHVKGYYVEWNTNADFKKFTF